MKKTKANITLASVAELGSGTLISALRKGICELRRPGRKKVNPSPIPRKNWAKKLSVILCTKGTCPVLPKAVESVLCQMTENSEVLVVWNGETPPAGELFPRQVRVVWEKTPGISFARNKGAKTAQGEILLYLDDDAVADKNLIKEMEKAFRSHPDTAIVGGQIFLKLPDPRPEVVLPGREGLWSAYRVPYTGYRQVREQYAFPYGACFGVRHDALLELGGFPTDYGRVGEDFGGGEETALCFLAQSRGWKIGIQPEAFVEHWVEPRRFSEEHVKKTIRAGILTTYRLSRDGYAPGGWDISYVTERLRIAELEWKKLQKSGNRLESYYKQCERDAFLELVRELEGAE